jgi:hypothetical protein
MDSRQVLARFGAERQALALMDHLSIAKVFDAGTTDTSRPYFVVVLYMPDLETTLTSPQSNSSVLGGPSMANRGGK